MSPERDFPFECLIELLLPTCIDEMVVAANDMGNAHIVIINDNGEHIGWGAICTKQNQIIEVTIIPFDSPLNGIFDNGFTVWNSEADDEKTITLLTVAIRGSESCSVVPGFFTF